MSTVNTSVEMIRKQIAELHRCAEQMERAGESLQQQYQQLGIEWKDDKYRMLGGIVEESKRAMRSVEKTLLEGEKGLCLLLQIVKEYEAVNLTGGGQTGTAQTVGASDGEGTAQPGANGAEDSGPVNTVESIKEWITRINPHYGNPFFPDSKVNCGSCAYAVEQRLNGNTTITASLNNIGTDRGMELATGKKCVYMSVEDIENKLKSMGAGSHLIVGINRVHNGKPISGHWFNAFYDGQEIYTIDGQSGEIYEWPHDYVYVSEWCAMV